MRVLVAVPSDGDPAHRAVLRGLVGALRRAGADARGVRGFSRLGVGADVVHAHLFSRAADPRAFSRLGGRTVLVVTHQGAAAALSDDAAALARLAARADALTAVSAAGRAELEALARFPVSVVPNGADRLPLRRRPGRRGPPEVLTVGRLAAYKGLDILAVALAELAARGLRTRWTALGPDQTGGRLPAFARRLGLDARFPGAVPPAAVRRALARAAVFVQPSRLEGSALALAEAMSAGLPVVASRAGGNPALVGRGGLLVPVGDARALSRALARVLGGPALARRLGAAARRRSRRSTWDEAARRYMRLYARAVRAKSPRLRLDSAA